MSKKIQLQLEQQYSRTYTNKYLKQQFEEAGMWSVIDNMVQEVNDFVGMTLPDNRPDLKEVQVFFMDANIEDLLWKMACSVMTKQSVTVASLAGIVFHSIKLSNKHRRFLAIEILLNVLDASPLMYSEITKGEECLFKAYNQLPQDVREHISHQGYPLPMVTKPRATSNSDLGYLSFNESVIAGGELKHHEGDIVLSNINRANSVAYSVEPRLFELVEFKFNPKPKIKDNGYYEDKYDIAKRKEQFMLLEYSMPRKVQIMLNEGNKFHLAHRVDNRLRRYAKGHEFNYQGCKFIKSMVMFNHSEIVQGEW